MSKYAPWTKEEAEAIAYNVVIKSGWTNENDKMRIAEGFYACLAWVAEMIEASPTVYQHVQPDIWCEVPYNEPGLSKHSAKLVGVRPIEGEK